MKPKRAVGTNESSNVLTLHLQKILRDIVSRKGIQNAIIAIARGDGSFRWIGAAGTSRPDGTPMREDTPYFIASVDKLFTATVILKLYERGLVGLDGPISTYLDKNLISGIHRWGKVDYSGSITVRNLLSHTSGLADWLEDQPKGGRSMIDHLIRDGDMSISVYDILSIVRDQLVPHFPPQPGGAKRQRVRYSDTNYILLVAIIEAVTGKPLHEVHDEFFIHALDLRSTWLAGHSKPLAPTSEPSVLWFENKLMEIPLMLRSTWAIFSTADDTLKFMHALVSGKLFDSPATLTLMQQRWNRFAFPLDRAALRLPTWPIEYGLGLMRFHDLVLKVMSRLPRVLTPVYPAPAIIGHTGSTGTWLFYCPELDLLLSGTVNQATAGAVPYRLIPKILRAIDTNRQPSDEAL